MREWKRKEREEKEEGGNEIAPKKGEEERGNSRLILLFLNLKINRVRSCNDCACILALAVGDYNFSHNIEY